MIRSMLHLMGIWVPQSDRYPMILTLFMFIVVFAAPTMVEAVKKAQQENATTILSRAFRMCTQKRVSLTISLSFLIS